MSVNTCHFDHEPFGHAPIRVSVTALLCAENDQPDPCATCDFDQHVLCPEHDSDGSNECEHFVSLAGTCHACDAELFRTPTALTFEEMREADDADAWLEGRAAGEW